MIDGMTDPHFQVERYGHLASMGSMRYVDTCGGFPPETLHCVLRHAFEKLLTKERCMLLWGQSVSVALPPFPQKSAVICGKELVKVLSRLLASEHEIMVASDHGADPESGAHRAAHSLFYQPLNGNSQNMKTA